MNRSLEAGIAPDAPDGTDALRQSNAATIPLGRYAEPDDIADMAV